MVHPRVNFLNPTTNLWPILLESVGEVTYFGPGRNDPEILDLGFEHFMSQLPREPDLLVFSELVTNPDGEGGNDKRAKQLSKIYGYKKSEAFRFLAQKERWIRDAKRSRLPTLLTFFEFDPYRVAETWCDRVDGWADAIIMGWGVEFVRPLSELPLLHDELFAQSATDLWHDLLESNSSRVFSQPAFVSDEEFHYAPLGTRPRDLSILGTTYSARRRARMVAKAQSMSQSGRYLHPLVATYDRITSGALGNKTFIEVSRRLFRRSLYSSRMSFTCGSGLEYPLRKMLEIPAAGTALAMRPTKTTQALGFIPWRNFIPSEPEDIPQITTSILQARLSEIQSIADAGQKLVANKHSLNARAPMTAKVVTQILRSKFSGSYWQDGQHLERDP